MEKTDVIEHASATLKGLYLTLFDYPMDSYYRGDHSGDRLLVRCEQRDFTLSGSFDGAADYLRSLGLIDGDMSEAAVCESVRGMRKEQIAELVSQEKPGYRGRASVWLGHIERNMPFTDASSPVFEL